jgi:hypothetical protein
MPFSPKSIWPSSLRSSKAVPDRLDGARGRPFTVKVSPAAVMGLAVVLRANAPAPLTLIVLPPGLEAVPRSAVPPVTSTAAWL